MKRVTFKNEQLHLVGRPIQVGEKALSFQVVTKDFEKKSLSDFSSKVKLITTFLSLDTPVCDLQVKKFNKEALAFSKDVVMLGISKDLPFAQKRFCEAYSIENLFLLSDYQNSSFGINYGLLIKELSLLARAVLILDQNDTIRYMEVVSEQTNAPNFEEALKNLQSILKEPVPIQSKESLHCLACEGKAALIAEERLATLLKTIPTWTLVDGKKIVREWKFADFSEAKYFVDLLAAIAEQEQHHPSILLVYNKVKVTLTTHFAQGLTDNDITMARIIDSVF